MLLVTTSERVTQTAQEMETGIVATTEKESKQQVQPRVVAGIWGDLVSGWHTIMSMR